MCAPHSAHLGCKMRLGTTSDLRIEFHLTGHYQRDLHAILCEPPKLARNMLVAMQTRRFVKYNGVGQEPLNGHRSVKHERKLDK